MGRYRKKPVVIEAIQFNGYNLKKIEEFAKEKCTIARFKGSECTGIGIDTLEGLMIASVGDYIIKGVNGEFYPCKPDIFEKTYEIEGESEEKKKIGRYIDADVLIEAMKKKEEEYENIESCPNWFTALRVIKEQPTAYDVEKVVKEIKRQSVCTNGCLTIGEDEAIDIVKAGGKEVNEN